MINIKNKLGNFVIIRPKKGLDDFIIWRRYSEEIFKTAGGI